MSLNTNTIDSNSIGCSNSNEFEIQQILKKKIYEGKIYYFVRWFGSEEPTWELAEKCLCDDLIEEYENAHADDEEEDEWEVEKILDKRMSRNKVEYLIKWKDWPGPPTWEKAENCRCINLIAAYENPKLKRLWDFKSSNEKLWLSRKAMLKYMRRYIRNSTDTGTPVNLLRFEVDFPKDEEQLELCDGINIGPVSYANHWYLVIILMNHINMSRCILVGDSLNLLIGTKRNDHPVIKRLKKVYKHFPIRVIEFTQMDRADVCAYYALAAFERALFLLHHDAQYIVNSIYFDPVRAEQIRADINPETNGEISLALTVPEHFDHGPMCEFCKELFETRRLLDAHIYTSHLSKYQNLGRSSKKPKLCK